MLQIFLWSAFVFVAFFTLVLPIIVAFWLRKNGTDRWRRTVLWLCLIVSGTLSCLAMLGVIPSIF